METLINYASKYEEYYQQPPQSIFHTACSCITSQQVSFNVGRNIRKSLYSLCGFPLTREAIINNDLTIIKNLTNTRINLIKQMANIDDERDNIDVLNDYAKLKGFGPWSYNAVSILLRMNNKINLANDAYIRKNLSSYMGYDMTEEQCRDFLNTADDHSTAVCYLLWRLKPQSINKIKNNEFLFKEDFV